MKMHLFILPSEKKNAGGDMTIRSFPSECIQQVNSVRTWKDINHTIKTASWFGMFYDNEYIDKAVKKNLNTLLMTIGNNALVLFKKNYKYQTADYCPRIFRAGIQLCGLFKTMEPLEYEKILNGWVCEHGYK